MKVHSSVYIHIFSNKENIIKHRQQQNTLGACIYLKTEMYHCFLKAHNLAVKAFNSLAIPSESSDSTRQ